MNKLALLVVSFLALSACEEEVVPAQETIRSVKTITISAATQTNSRQIAGVVKSATTGDLSFRVGGQVVKVNTQAGEKVKRGDILAVIDQKEYRLAVQSAQAKLTSARADLTEKSDNLRRQRNLRAKDFVAAAAVDQAVASFGAARSQVQVAEAALENAQNDLSNTELKAPFDGSVAARSVEPFTEVSAGEVLFELQGESALQVEVLMPETLIRDVSYGDGVSVRFPTLENTAVDAVVNKIGTKAETGNAFPVTVDLAQTPADIRPGMTAQVTFNYGEAGDQAVYVIPVSALDVRIPAASEEAIPGEAPVFILKDGKAVQRKIQIRDIRGNEFEAVGGLSEGDELIVAGVPFLRPGQEVKPWTPSYNTSAAISQ